MPARAVIVLKRTGTSPVTYAFVLRADVPTLRQSLYANPSYVSPFQPIAPDTDPDLTALRSGAVVEKSDSWQVQSGVTIAEVQAGLLARQAAFQSSVTANPDWSRYGTYWDGTKWVPQGV